MKGKFRTLTLVALILSSIIILLVGAASKEINTSVTSLISGLLLWLWGATAICFKFFPTDKDRKLYEESEDEKYTAVTYEKKELKIDGHDVQYKVEKKGNVTGRLVMKFLGIKIRDSWGRSILWWRMTYAFIMAFITGLLACQFFKVGTTTMQGAKIVGGLASVCNVLSILSIVMFASAIAAFVVRWILEKAKAKAKK